MKPEEILLNQKAYESYNLDTRENVDEEVLEYIKLRLYSNRKLLEELANILKQDFDFNAIINIFNKELKKERIYKVSREFERLENGFNHGSYATSKGLILVETNNLQEIVRYLVRAIKSRNSITIADYDFQEISLSSAIMIIFCEALAKYGIDRNLLVLMPYEECFPKYYDEVILIEETTKVQENELQEKYIIYKENADFENIIQNEENILSSRGLNYEIIENIPFEEAIDFINKIKPIGTSMYTKDVSLIPRFINLIHSPNVFINSSLTNVEKNNLLTNELYMKKNIIYPSNQVGKEIGLQEEAEMLKENNFIDNPIKKNESNTSSVKIEETSNKEELLEGTRELTVHVTPWYKKIFKAIKEFFKK